MKLLPYKAIFLTVFLWTAFNCSAVAIADDNYCEVMSVQGTVTSIQEGVSAPVKSGDLLKVGSIVQVGPDSYVDLAYDKAWKNVTRIRENSEVKLGSVQPTHIDMTHGDIFSRIKVLSKDSSFEIQTPTALAAVRGTEFRTIADLDGTTEVQNASELPTSQVLVYGLDVSGNRQAEPLFLDTGNKTEVPKLGDQPLPPTPMSPEEIAKGNQDNANLKDSVPDTSNLPGDHRPAGDDKDAGKHGNDDDKRGFDGPPADGPGTGPGDNLGPGGPGDTGGPGDDSGRRFDSTGGGAGSHLPDPGETPLAKDPYVPTDFVPPPTFTPPAIPENIQNITNTMQSLSDKMADTTQNVENKTLQLPPPPPPDKTTTDPYIQPSPPT